MVRRGLHGVVFEPKQERDAEMLRRVISKPHRAAEFGHKQTILFSPVPQMTRPLSPEREREFQELMGFVSFYATHVSGVSQTSTLSIESVCASIIEQHGKSKALEGLRQAANDVIEELSDKRAAGVAVLDEALRASGLITASEVRRRYASSYKRITKRGTIRNDTEYYLINGIVVDFGNGISDEERAALQLLLDRYEAAAKGKT